MKPEGNPVWGHPHLPTGANAIQCPYSVGWAHARLWNFQEFCERVLKLLIAWNHPQGEDAHHENGKLVKAIHQVSRLLNIFQNPSVKAQYDGAPACPLLWLLQIPLSAFSLSSTNRSLWSQTCWLGFCLKSFNLFLFALMFPCICTWLIPSHSAPWWNITPSEKPSLSIQEREVSVTLLLPYFCFFIVRDHLTSS